MIQGFYFRTLFRDEKDGYTVFLLKTSSEILSLSGHLPQYTLWTPLQISEKEDSSGKLYAEAITESSAGFAGKELKLFFRENGVSDPEKSDVLMGLCNGNDLYRLAETKCFRIQLEKAFGKGDSSDLIQKILLPRLQRQFMEHLIRLMGQQAFSRFFLVNRYVDNLQGAAISNFHLHFYSVCSEHLGISFHEADLIAQRLGIQTAEERIKAIGTAVLRKSAQSGHTCMSVAELTAEICSTLYEADGKVLSAADAERMLKCGGTVICGGHSGYVSLQGLYQAERIIANGVFRLLNGQKDLFSDEELENAACEAEKHLGITYAFAQKRAFRLFRRSGPVILTGGPGTGKTTVINGLIRAYMHKYPSGRIILTAPTGRAAQRMSASTGMNASTVHRLTEIGRLNRRGNTDIDADLLVVDEASMLDTEMASWLFSGVRDDCLLLLVGDTDQLPSVGPGDVLHNLIDSGRIPVCRLETVYRQKGTSLIVTNAGYINHGVSALRQDDTFRVIHCEKDPEIPEKVRDAVLGYLKNTQDPLETQVLCPSYKGAAGIEALNRMLQNVMNPGKSGRSILKFGSTEFRLNDKIITTSNNYTLGYCNGDIGTISTIGQGEMTVNFPDRKIVISSKDLRDVSLAYCISIHKSQGSEFRNAVVVLPAYPSGMLKRNLLYTAVTRAKANCTIITSGGSLSLCCRKAEQGKRITRLSELLKR